MHERQNPKLGNLVFNILYKLMLLLAVNKNIGNKENKQLFKICSKSATCFNKSANVSHLFL